MKIKTKKGVEVLIDRFNYAKIKGKSLYYCQMFEFKKGYIYIRTDKKSIGLHRFLTNCPKDLVVDHINGNPLDNRMENLRICTKSENSQYMWDRIKNLTTV